MAASEAAAVSVPAVPEVREVLLLPPEAEEAASEVPEEVALAAPEAETVLVGDLVARREDRPAVRDRLDHITHRFLSIHRALPARFTTAVPAAADVPEICSPLLW